MLRIVGRVPCYQMQNYGYFYAVLHLIFSAFFTGLREGHISRKVAKTKDFYIFARCSKQTVSTCGIFRQGYNIIRTSCKLSILHPFRDFQIIAVKPLPFSVQTGLVTSLTESTPISCYTYIVIYCYKYCCRYRHNFLSAYFFRP